ncbi:MAG: DUF4190 domain-containing protein [Eubacterium sp.]|nr:DUF4190 domain-containing protein [Eubacterium sp.]
MSEDNWYSQGEGRFSEEERSDTFQDAQQRAIYQEGTPQYQGEYRDLETDFQKPDQQNTYRQTYQGPYQEQFQPVSQGFGVASLVIGIVSLVLFCSCLNIPLAILAIVFGIVQLTKPGSKKGMAVGGIVTSVISLIAFVVFCIGIWGSVDFQEGFQEGFQRGLRRSPEEQLEDGYLDDYGIPDEDEDRYLDDDGFWDEDDRFEDDIMDTF